VLLYRRHRRAALLLSSTLLLYPLIHYVVQFEARYRYSIFWAAFLPAAYAVLEIIRWLRGAPQAHANPPVPEIELVPIFK
jgi:hypothetical protein